MSLTVTDLQTAYGQYYLNSGQSQADVLRSFKRGRTLPSFANARMTKNTIAQLAESFMTSVLQPFHKTFSHKGDAAFLPNMIQLYRVKIDQTLTPDDIVESWAGFMTDPTNVERKDWPIIRYIWEVLIAEQAAQDYEHADWAAIHAAAPGGGTPGSHLAIYNGLRKLIVTGLADGDRPMHDLGNLGGLDPSNSAQVFDALEYIAGQIPQFWAGKQIDFYVPQAMELAYFRDRRNTFTALESARANPGGPMTIDGRPNWRIIPFGGMDADGDDNSIFVSPRQNVLHYTQSQSYNMGMTVDTRTVKLYADWFEGLGFGLNDLVYAYIPEASS